MISQVFTDCLAEYCTLPYSGKSFRRKPSAEPTTLAQSIVGYTFSFFADAQRRSLSYSVIPEVDDAI